MLTVSDITATARLKKEVRTGALAAAKGAMRRCAIAAASENLCG